jgi:DNA-binding transcriptional ArsR family regulator
VVDPLRIVSHPRRREILRLVWTEELPAGAIASRFDVTFGAVSQHLAVLREAGLVRVRAAGNQRFYRADHERLGPLAPMLEEMWASTLDRLATAVESDPEPSVRDRSRP